MIVSEGLVIEGVSKAFEGVQAVRDCSLVVRSGEIVSLLGELVRANGMTLVFVTHDIALASGFADRIAVFRGGRLVEAGPTADLMSKPKDEYTASLIASHIDLSTPPLVVEDAA